MSSPSLRRIRGYFIFAILLAVAAHSGLAAEPEDVQLQFPRLDLTDGRKLRNVVVKSFNPDSGKLLVIADGKAMSFPITLVPPPFDERLKAAPVSGSTVSTIATPPRPVTVTPPTPAQRGAPPVVTRPMPLPAAFANSTPPTRARPPTATELIAAQAGDDLNAHKAAAVKRAHEYYRYEARLGSDAATVFDLSLDTTTPQPVPGWTGRYRTQGKAHFVFYDARGRSFNRRTSTFEVVTEQKPGDDDLRVTDFTPKS